MKRLKHVVGCLLLLFVMSCDNSLTQSTIKTTDTHPTTTTTETLTQTTIPTTTLDISTVLDTCSIYETPDVDVVNTFITETTFTFDLDYVKTGCLGQIDEMYIYQSNTFNTVYTFTEFDLETFMATNLESRTDYTLRIEYGYVHSGYQTNMVFLYSFRTDSDILVEIIDVDKTTDSFSFDLYVNDPDNVVYIRHIEVFEGSTMIAEFSFGDTYEVTGLDVYTEYKVEVEYGYPIRHDTYGNETERTILWVTTLPDVPMVTVTEIKTYTDRYDFTVDQYDPDDLITIDSLTIYQADTIVFETTLTEYLGGQNTISDLEASQEYLIRIVYHYDLGDGVETVIYDHTFYTAEPHPLTVTIDNTYASHKTLIFDIELLYQTPDLTIQSVSLYQGSTLIDSFENTSGNFTFNDLEASTTYKLEIVSGYNCTGDVCEDTLKTVEFFRTDEPPVTQVLNMTVTSTSVTFDVIITDNGFGEVIEVSLLNPDTEEVLATISDLTTLTNLSFSGLNPNTEYIIYVHYHNDVISSGDVSESWLKQRITTTAE